MQDDGDGIVISHNEAAQRYETQVDGHLAVLEYQRTGDRIVFVHTGVPSELEGHGIAGRLAHRALEEARAGHLSVIPRCPFVAAYIRRHPEYLDLVPPHERGRLEKR